MKRASELLNEIKKELKCIDEIKKIDKLLSKNRFDTKWIERTKISIDVK